MTGRDAAGSGSRPGARRRSPRRRSLADDPTVVAAFAIALKAGEIRAARGMLVGDPRLALQHDQSGCPLIVHAVRTGDAELVRMMCDAGARLSELAGHGDTLAHRGRLLYAAGLFRHGQRGNAGRGGKKRR